MTCCDDWTHDDSTDVVGLDGKPDELGYYSIENPVHVHDLQVTVLHLLDHLKLTYRFQSRDFRLTNAQLSGSFALPFFELRDRVWPDALAAARGGYGRCLFNFRVALRLFRDMLSKGWIRSASRKW